MSAREQYEPGASECPVCSIVTFVSTGPAVRIGGFLLRELADGSLWLENEIGEGMQVQASRLEVALLKFMTENF